MSTIRLLEPPEDLLVTKAHLGTPFHCWPRRLGPSPEETGHHQVVRSIRLSRRSTTCYGTIMGRTRPGSSHERVLPVATRPHAEYRLTPPLTLSEEDPEDDEIT